MIFDKLKKFDIIFDSPELDCPPVFSNGDVVSGRVVLDLSGECRVDSLKLHAEGFAKVHWTESRSAGSSTAYTQNYSDEVEYLNRKEVLLQAGQSAVQTRGDGGEHRQPYLKQLAEKAAKREIESRISVVNVYEGTLPCCLSAT